MHIAKMITHNYEICLQNLQMQSNKMPLYVQCIQ
jgi:hypothetical protein